MSEKITVAMETSGMRTKQPTGVSVYTANLIQALRTHPDEIVINEYYRSSPLSRRYADIPSLENANSYLYPSLVPRYAGDVFHSTDNKFLYKSGRINIATIHDVAIFLPEHRFPGYYSEGFAAKLSKYNREIAAKADAIIAVSNSTKADFCQLFDVDEAKVRVVYPGFQRFESNSTEIVESVLLDKYELGRRRYILFVGAVSIRKNVMGLLRSFALSGLQGSYKLVLAGPLAMDEAMLFGEIERLDLTDSIVFTSYNSDSALGALYRNAVALAFPTFYEGFGIPILEAMHLGLPVLIGNRGAAPEIASGFAVESDPFDDESIAAGLNEVIAKDRHDRLAIEHASQFTWDRAANEIISIYREFMGRI